MRIRFGSASARIEHGLVQSVLQSKARTLRAQGFNAAHALHEYLHIPAAPGAEGRQRVQSSGYRLLASGALLAMQWACYAWAIQHTSLPHALLFLSATPVLLAAWTWLNRQPISAGAHRAWYLRCIALHMRR